ncbi:MAG: hypothetical protein JWO67_2053 [Streptosporangiaceae bacterium]|nr:hypothetical protein [Streptosporangiaceae bacterium]
MSAAKAGGGGVTYPIIYDQVTCVGCGQWAPDIMLTRDPRVVDGPLVDLCGTCHRVSQSAADRVQSRRTALRNLAGRWVGSDDDYAAASRLLRDTGLPLDTRWARFKTLVAAASTGERRSVDEAADALTGDATGVAA